MRNAMICASVMLAVFLGWPLAFGDQGGPRFESPKAQAHVVRAEAAAVVDAGEAIKAPSPDEPKRPESCYKRFQRENRQCGGTHGAACRLKANDQWDLCEATGFWPD